MFEKQDNDQIADLNVPVSLVDSSSTQPSNESAIEVSKNFVRYAIKQSAVALIGNYQLDSIVIRRVLNLHKAALEDLEAVEEARCLS